MSKEREISLSHGDYLESWNFKGYFREINQFYSMRCGWEMSTVYDSLIAKSSVERLEKCLGSENRTMMKKGDVIPQPILFEGFEQSV